MQLYPRRRNVAAQVTEELKTVTYTTPPMEECRKKGKKSMENSFDELNANIIIIIIIILFFGTPIKIYFNDRFTFVTVQQKCAQIMGLVPMKHFQESFAFLWRCHPSYSRLAELHVIHDGFAEVFWW